MVSRGVNQLHILDNILEGCQIISRDWTYLYVNDAAARHGRRAKHELLGRTMMEVYPGIEQTAVFYALRQCIDEGVPSQMENFFTYPDGAEGWFELSIHPVPEGAFVLSIDITDRKLAERALDQQRRRLVEAQRIARLGDFTWDVQTGEVSWSEGLFDLLGYEKTEGIDYARVNAEIHHPDDLERVTRWLNDCIASGSNELTPNEYRIRRSDGKSLYVRTVGRIERGEGGGAKVFATVQDVTERKSAEQALHDSESRYRNLFMHSPDAILVNQKGRVVLANEACLKLFGAGSADDLVDRSVLDLILPEYHQLIRDRAESLQEAGVTLSPLEHRIRRLDGEVVDVDVVAAPFLFGDTSAIHVILHDLTTRKRAEREREALRTQLDQARKMESIGRLAGGVAHDFNNLLAVILGYGDLLTDELEPDDQRRTFVEMMMDAGLRARDLVHQLLAFSRKQTLDMKPVNLNATIKNFEKLLRRTIPEDIGIMLLLSPDVRPVMADNGQMEQVIMNLATNAAEAMPDGGSITIETALVTLGRRYVDLHVDVVPGRYVMLALSDTGCGMDEQTRESIFDPFFSTKGEQGTGLGLATVYGIIRQHEGYIWVYSEPGKGTTFKIYLPLAGRAEAEISPAQEEISDLTGSESILLVEDNQEVRRMVHTVLARRGYHLLEAKDAAEALDLLNTYQGPLHLLLTDVVMPGMDGRELYGKCLQKHPELKALFMSGYTDDVIAHRGVLDEGVNFIQKPFSIQAIALKVRQVLEQP